MGLYDSTFGLVLYALSMVIAFTILIWWNARLLQHADFVRQQTQVQLSASKEREAAILYAALDAVITIDYQGHVLEFNPAAQEIFGYHRTEVLGRQMSQLIIPPRFRERHRIGLAKYLETGEGPVLGKRIELMGMRADGTEFPVELTITTIATGEQPFFTGFVRDITQRKVAEAQIAYQAYLLENVNDAVIGSDENSIIRFWNQGAERMFGWKAEEAIGHPGREILRSEFIGTDRETVFKILAAQSRWKGEAILYHKDGTPVITEVSSITLRDVNGMITGYVSVNRDIAERKQAEEKIRQQNQRLKVLREIDAAILAADSVENIVGAALSHVRDLIDCRRANLTLIDWETNESVIFDVTKVNETSIPKGMRFPLDQYEDMIQALSQDQLLLMNDLRRLADPRPAIQSLLKEGLQSLCSLPFSSQGKLLGMFSMYSEIPNFFDEERISLGREVANQIAIAIKQNDLHNSLRELNVELEQRVSDRTAALSQANALLQTLLDHMLDHIYFKDSQGRFIRNSRSQASALGLSDPAEAIGKSDFDFFPHAQLSYEKEQEIMRTGKPLVNQEELVVWPDGHETWVLTTKMPLLDQTGQIIGTFGISRDITERKQSEVALHKAKLELEAANKELESFSYSVSHDLRAPLRRIDGYGQAILEDYGELLPTEGREFLERIRSAAQHMAALIDDLLNLSRVTRAPLQLMPVDLTKLAKDILEELQRSHPERTVSCSVKPNLNVRGDPRLLQVVLENLLNNAWKYSSKQGQAKIEFGAKDQNDETIYFVRDNGAGFEMAYANKLFGAFQRLHTTTEFPGTGIGLATVQRIIHRHGGRIWAESIVNQGATFFFTLPTVGGAQPKVDQEEDSMMRRVKEII
jgi:PAS domain S-box-containing protein